ncbi:MAG TPA: hypothetical protein VH044_04505, partial [Polyangiaceae bacterium]|nr:hypothetical protein [Polyangiaceae bacterium]
MECERLGPAVAALWIGAMLASFVGWGSLVEHLLAPGLARGRRTDWGLRAGWGMAAFVLTGGFLCAARAATRPVLVTQVVLGVMALLVLGCGHAHERRAVPWRRGKRPARAARTALVAAVGAAYALAAITALAYLGRHTFQPSDDPPFYFALPEKLLQTGSMFEPFAARRASSFGGQVYLHAAFLSVADVYYLHAVDAGLCAVMVVALLVGLPVGGGREGRREGRREGLRAPDVIPLALATAVLFTLEDVRVNTASLMSGVAAVLTLYRTVRAPLGPPDAGDARADAPPWPMDARRVVALAALALASIVLRTSNAAAVLPFVVFVILLDLIAGVPRPWSGKPLIGLARTAGLAAVAFVVLLAPWSIAMRESTGTLFFPFGHSFITPGWTFLAWPESLAGAVVMHARHAKPVFFVPFAVVGLVPLAAAGAWATAGETARKTARATASSGAPGEPGRFDLVALTAASIVGFVAQAAQSAGFGVANTARYYFAYVTATSLLVAASGGESRRRQALVAAAVITQLAMAAADLPSKVVAGAGGLKDALFESRDARRAFAASGADYAEVQSHVPAGATLATAVFEPYRFDFRRNRVDLLDFLGAMGPPPGWPYGQGPDALASYLLRCGVQYLAWVDFDLPNEFYSRANWTSHLAKTGHYLQGEAPFELDAESAIDGLATRRRVVYRGHGITV